MNGWIITRSIMVVSSLLSAAVRVRAANCAVISTTSSTTKSVVALQKYNNRIARGIITSLNYSSNSNIDQKENPNDLIILSSNQAIKVMKAIAKITPGIA